MEMLGGLSRWKTGSPVNMAERTLRNISFFFYPTTKTWYDWRGRSGSPQRKRIDRPIFESARQLQPSPKSWPLGRTKPKVFQSRCTMLECCAKSCQTPGSSSCGLEKSLGERVPNSAPCRSAVLPSLLPSDWKVFFSCWKVRRTLPAEPK